MHTNTHTSVTVNCFTRVVSGTEGVEDRRKDGKGRGTITGIKKVFVKRKR